MISSKNLTLLLAVLLMGFVLISSASAADIDDSVSISDSDEVSDAGLSQVADENYASDSNLNDVESEDASSSNVNSENEVLSTDNTVEDSALEHDSNVKNTKNVLGASSQSDGEVLQANAKTKTNLKGSSSSIMRGKYYTLTLTDSKGKVLTGQKVSYKINGKTYTLTTDSKGSTYLQINLKEGKYAMTCSYGGSNTYASSSFSVTLSVLKNPNYFTVKEIEDAATKVKNYVDKNKKLPKTVKVGNRTLKISEFNFLASKAISNLNSNNRGDILLVSGISNCNSSTHSFKSTVYKAQYVDLAKKSITKIESKKVPATYWSVKNNSSKVIGKANFNLYTFAFAKILDFHKSKNYLPNYCAFDSSVFAPAKKATSLKGSSSTLTRGKSYKLTLTDSKGNVLAGRKVSFNINGKTYTLTTDKKGSAYLQINLREGKYPMVCSYAGSKTYKASKLSVNVNVLKNPNFFTVKEIENAATNVKNYVEKNKKLPNTVKVGERTLKISEFSYLSSKAISNLNSNNKGDILLVSGISNGNSSSHSFKSTVYKAQYVDLAKKTISRIESKKVPSTYWSVKNNSSKVIGKANFNLYTYSFAKILDFHKSKNYLPNYCTFDSSSFTPAKKATSIKAGSTSIKKGDAYSVTLVDANDKGLANQKITFTISGKSYNKTTNSNGVASLTINLNAGNYSVAVSYAGSSTYKASKLSKTLTVKDSNKYTLGEIEAAATNVKKYVDNNDVLPSTVTVANKKLSISQFSYLMTKAVYNINAGNTNSIALPSGISNCDSDGDSIDATVYKAQYLDLSKRVLSFAESNKVPPVYAKVYSSSGSSLGNAEFDLYTYSFAKILDFHKSKNYLPNYCTFESSVFKGSVIPANVSSKIPYNSSQFKEGLNEKNSETNLTKYLVGTGQSAITSSIKNLAAKLTKGLNTTEQKAQAIYNYVRDEIDYSYYANSKYGASGTLSAGSGNCVDQASLVVALCRASGIHARYSHAKGCTFSSGLVTGHVWAQILVNGVWYSADATSVRNSLGNIRNWNTKSYSNLNQYAAVPF